MSRLLSEAGEGADNEFLSTQLASLSAQPLTPAQLAGYADAMREVSIAVPLTESERSAVVDTCGTGGDSAACPSFNISTAAAILVSACGVPVAKHGNRASTSRCGSADVLEALGIPLSTTPDDALARLRGHNFAFLFAPAFHPALAPLAPIRKALGRRTVFNLLGPLANPAGVRRQVIGVPERALVPVFAGALQLLGIEHALVVHGHNGMDEITLTGPTYCAEVRAGRLVREFAITAEDFGFATHTAPDAYGGGDAPENAALLTRLFTSPVGCVFHREIVLANAAAALYVAGRAAEIGEGAQIAAEALDSGAAGRKLEELRSQEIHA